MKVPCSTTHNIYIYADSKDEYEITPFQYSYGFSFFVLFLILFSDKDDQYRVLASYEASNIGETSLVEGTIVTIVEKNERGIIIFNNCFYNLES